MWTHLGHFLGTVLGIFFNAIGSTLLGLLIDGAFAASIAVAALYRKRRTEGWRPMLVHWRREYRAGLKFAFWAAVLIYSPVVIWSVGKAAYDDHQGLVARSRQQRATIHDDAGLLETQKHDDLVNLNGCQNQSARIDGQNDTLGKQNRDQQNMINHCQEDAIKLLTPTAQETTVLYFDKDQSKQPPQARFLLLTNVSMSPVTMTIQCNWSLDSASISPLGVTSLTSTTTRLTPTAWLVSSEVWTPKVPLLATIRYYRAGDITCTFTPR